MTPIVATPVNATSAPSAVKTVVVVNADPTDVDLLDTSLERGRYEMVFTGVRDRAYSTIRRLQPDLVILYTGLEDADGFQLLTMLKVDPATRTIPVLTYAGDEGQPDTGALASRTGHDDLPSLLPASYPRMN